MRSRYPESEEERAARLVGTAKRIALAPSAGALESAAASAPSEQEVATRMSSRLQKGGVPTAEAEPISKAIARSGVDLMESAARHELKLEDVSADQLTSLEAVISVVGRPAWFIKDNAPSNDEEAIDASDEHWLVHIGNQLAKIKRGCARVGAIFKEEDGTRTEIGTGWMIGDGLLATNAHVARHLFFRRIVVPPGDPADGWRRRPGISGLVDFRFEKGGSGGVGFEVGPPCFIEPDESSQPDLAILSVSKRSGNSPPSRLDLELERTDGWVRALVFIVGHPIADVNDDPNVSVVFGPLDGTKRISPGESLGPLGDFVLAHDCSTVNGSSGSPVFDFATGKVAGLHYWGQPGARNECVFLPAIHDHPALVKSLAGGFAA